MSLKNYLFSIVALFSIVFISCDPEGEEEEPFECSGWNVQYTAYKINVGAAYAPYNQSPTTANCQAYADVLNESIDGLQAYLDNDCIPSGSEAETDAIATLATWKSAEITASACANS